MFSSKLYTIKCHGLHAGRDTISHPHGLRRPVALGLEGATGGDPLDQLLGVLRVEVEALLEALHDLL